LGDGSRSRLMGNCARQERVPERRFQITDKFLQNGRLRFRFGFMNHWRRLANGLTPGLGLDRRLRHYRNFFHHRLRLGSRLLLDGNRSFFNYLNRGNIFGGELFDDRLSLNRDFLGGLHGGIDLGAEFVDLRSVVRQGLQLRQSGQCLLRHAVANIETNLFDGLIHADIGNLGSFGSGFRNLDRFFDCHRRRVVGLNGDRVVPLGRKIDFLAG
jgi:hypothetical protein